MTMMRVEHINPFIVSLKETFSTMLGWEVCRGQPVLKQGETTRYDVSGVIGLSGNAVGTVVLSFPAHVALKAASAMLMSEATALDDDVLDAVGELTNMVAGRAKAELEEYHLMVSLPSVITGRDHEVHFPSNVTPILIPFETSFGPLALEVGLAPVRAENRA